MDGLTRSALAHPWNELERRYGHLPVSELVGAISADIHAGAYAAMDIGDMLERWAAVEGDDDADCRAAALGFAGMLRHHNERSLSGGRSLWFYLKPHHCGTPLLAAMRRVGDSLIATRDRAAWEALPDVVTIYRGTGERDPAVIARESQWTLDPAVAAVYALIHKGAVYRATVARSDVLFYVNTEYNAEIITEPGTTKQIAFIEGRYYPLLEMARPCFSMAAYRFDQMQMPNRDIYEVFVDICVLLSLRVTGHFPEAIPYFINRIITNSGGTIRECTPTTIRVTEAFAEPHQTWALYVEIGPDGVMRAGMHAAPRTPSHSWGLAALAGLGDALAPLAS